MTTYLRTDHPAVGAVACPHCGQPAGVPCKAPRQKEVEKYGFKLDRQYVGTHRARVRKAQEQARVSTVVAAGAELQ